MYKIIFQYIYIYGTKHSITNDDTTPIAMQIPLYVSTIYVLTYFISWWQFCNLKRNTRMSSQYKRYIFWVTCATEYKSWLIKSRYLVFSLHWNIRFSKSNKCCLHRIEIYVSQNQTSAAKIFWNRTRYSTFLFGWSQIVPHWQVHAGTCMVTSSNGNIFRVTGHWGREFTGHRWISRTKASDAEIWCFLWSAPE